MNRIDRPGTAEEAWDSWAELGHLPAADPAAWASAVIASRGGMDRRPRRRSSSWASPEAIPPPLQEPHATDVAASPASGRRSRITSMSRTPSTSRAAADSAVRARPTAAGSAPG